MDIKQNEIFTSIISNVSRRKFLKSVAAAGLLININSQPASASSNAKGKIIVIGGGAAGLSTAARLARKLDSPDITVIDPADRQFYQPGFTLIGGGVYTADMVSKSQESCIPHGVKWLKDEVLFIDPEKNYVTTITEKKLPYDFLVLTPGLQMNFEQVEGITRADLGKGNAHCIYDYYGAQRMWEAIQKFSETGGTGIFTNTYTKHKCGGAPKKINLLTEHYARKQGTRNKMQLSYFNANEKIFDTPFYATRLDEIFKERNIAHINNHRLVSVDTAKKIASFVKVEKTTVEEINPETGKMEKVEKEVFTPENYTYDLLHFLPPMSVPDFVRESGLAGKSKEGWIPVDKGTMIHKKWKNIISLGDASNLPTSKTSAAIRMQYPIAAANLISLMEGKEPTEIYNGYTACPIVTEYGKVLMAEFDYNRTPMPTFPIIDTSHEQWLFWLLKKYALKPIYFYGMLNGWM
ncbi:MAG: FAD/NAD(P)-binding oxidoreductase [Bacteroidales bacterium]|nr:FAD/NAD(P)-binding oxidoreductase [Bacteroidales bacterium]